MCYNTMKGVKPMSEKTEAQKRAQKNYMQKFSVARVRMEHDKYEQVQAHAAARGESVNGFIGRAITETMERDGTAQDAQEHQNGGGICTPGETETPQDDAAEGE